MKFLKVLLALSVGYSSIAHAKQEGFALQYAKPIIIKIYSNSKGVIKEEPMSCTPETCCFSERYYCIMDSGICYCDLHLCNQGSKEKSYWMELTGTEAERYCGRSRMLHELTNLCLCDPDKDSPCDQCNRPCPAPSSNPKIWTSLPPDCRPR